MQVLGRMPEGKVQLSASQVFYFCFCYVDLLYKSSCDNEHLTCSNISGTSVLQYDITSLGVCLCRHGFVMYLMNSFTGERHAYATLFLKKILEQGIAPQFVWYDINCRWSISFKRWLLTQPYDISKLADDIQFPLPPFHLYAHRCLHFLSFDFIGFAHLNELPACSIKQVLITGNNQLIATVCLQR